MTLELRPVVETAVTLLSADLPMESSAVDDKKLDKFYGNWLQMCT